MIYNVIEWCSKAIIGLYHQWFPEEQQLPMRVKDGLDEQQVTASMMKFDGEEDPWAWDYSAHPYTAAEQNEIVQLKQMEAYLPVLLNNPVVDQQKLVKKLLDLAEQPSGRPTEAGQEAVGPSARARTLGSPAASAHGTTRRTTSPRRGRAGHGRGRNAARNGATFTGR
jgi:hypothetical protein